MICVVRDRPDHPMRCVASFRDREGAMHYLKTRAIRAPRMGDEVLGFDEVSGYLTIKRVRDAVVTYYLSDACPER